MTVSGTPSTQDQEYLKETNYSEPKERKYYLNLS